MSSALAGWADDGPAEAITDIPIRIGVRADTAPFSLGTRARGAGEAGLCDPDSAADGPKGFRGYTVELCVDFVNDLRETTTRPFKACFVPVVTAKQNASAPNRFEALDSGAIDMLCGATTATLEVRSRYRTSMPTFLSATGFLKNDARVDARIQQGAPLRIGVLRHTTSDVRVSADALAQRRQVRASLQSARVPQTVILDSHKEVAERICARETPDAGCTAGLPEQVASDPERSSERETVAKASLSDLCRRSDLSFGEWLVRIGVRCTAVEQAQPGETEQEPEFVGERLCDLDDLTPVEMARSWISRCGKSDGATQTDSGSEADETAETTDEPRPPPAPVRDEIDIYIADRPILYALHASMALEGWHHGLSIDDARLKSQPYAVIFPPRPSQDAGADPRALPDLHFAFNRFLVEHTYNPGNLASVRQRLAAHFIGGTEASFLRLIPLMGQVPVGQEPQTGPPASAPAAVTAPASPPVVAPLAAGPDQSFGE